jgi:hypothetical protein
VNLEVGQRKPGGRKFERLKINEKGSIKTDLTDVISTK